MNDEKKGYKDNAKNSEHCDFLGNGMAKLYAVTRHFQTVKFLVQLNILLTLGYSQNLYFFLYFSICALNSSICSMVIFSESSPDFYAMQLMVDECF